MEFWTNSVSSLCLFFLWHHRYGFWAYCWSFYMVIPCESTFFLKWFDLDCGSGSWGLTAGPAWQPQPQTVPALRAWGNPPLLPLLTPLNPAVKEIWCRVRGTTSSPRRWTGPWWTAGRRQQMPRPSSWPGGSSGQYSCPKHSSFLRKLKGLWRAIFAFACSSQILIVIGCFRGK